MIHIDKEWYPLRRLNAAAFHHQNIENYVRIFQDCAETLTQRLLRVPNTSIDMDSYGMKQQCTLRIRFYFFLN